MTSVTKLAAIALGVVIATVLAVAALNANPPTGEDLGPPVEVEPSTSLTPGATTPTPTDSSPGDVVEPPTPVAPDDDDDDDDDDDHGGHGGGDDERDDDD
ncbi:MAG: hypothetical protein ACRDVZ_02895 [Jiangellaceae bacterium]